MRRRGVDGGVEIPRGGCEVAPNKANPSVSFWKINGTENGHLDAILWAAGYLFLAVEGFDSSTEEYPASYRKGGSGRAGRR